MFKPVHLEIIPQLRSQPPKTCWSLFTWRHPLTLGPGPWTCSASNLFTSHPYINKQAGGWPSTERPSCYWLCLGVQGISGGSKGAPPACIPPTAQNSSFPRGMAPPATGNPGSPLGIYIFCVVTISLIKSPLTSSDFVTCWRINWQTLQTNLLFFKFQRNWDWKKSIIQE